MFCRFPSCFRHFRPYLDASARFRLVPSDLQIIDFSSQLVNVLDDFSFFSVSYHLPGDSSSSDESSEGEDAKPARPPPKTGSDRNEWNYKKAPASDANSKVR